MKSPWFQHLRGVTAFVALTGGLLTGCARAPSTASAPARESVGRRVAPPLPAIPLVDSALAIRVVYPPQDYRLPARTPSDSNFIFGSVGSGRATLTINGASVPVAPNGAFLAWLPLPPGGPGDTLRYELVATRGTDVAREERRVLLRSRPEAVGSRPEAQPKDLAQAQGDSLAALPVFVRLGGAATPADTDRMVVGRPTPAGTYRWFFLPGTVAQLTGRSAGFARVRLDSTLDVWVDSADAPLATEVRASPRRVTSNVRLRADTARGFTDVVIRVTERPAYFVEETADALLVTLYDTKANTDQVAYGTLDRSVRSIEWEQVANDRALYTINLRRAPYGYMVMWEPGGLVVRVRDVPRIDPANPLRGRVIAVDPGHPPAGATGPTGLWEPQAALWVSERLRDMLVARGARVIMTRTTMDAVGLGDRPTIARQQGAEAFVSVHLNALPDGATPFAPRGSGTYFFHQHSEPLARAVQRGLTENIGLLDEGVYKANFAVVRNSPWFPGVLTEGLYLMHPAQENFLRTREGQERYARGILEGLERYFASLAFP
ncbi:MAG: N-acetylmuramoyl-L-alanine amidase family protein [Gemmatimonadaceae bacterium]